MIRTKFHIVAAVYMIWSLLVLAQSSGERKRWCGDKACRIILFETTATRNFSSSDSNFLKLTIGMKINVTGFRFNHRPDFFEGMTATGEKGMLYEGFVEKEPLLKYLKKAIDNNISHYDVYFNGSYEIVPNGTEILEKIYTLKMEDLISGESDKNIEENLNTPKKDNFSQMSPSEEKEKKEKPPVTPTSTNVEPKVITSESNSLTNQIVNSAPNEAPTTNIPPVMQTTQAKQLPESQTNLMPTESNAPSLESKSNDLLNQATEEKNKSYENVLKEETTSVSPISTPFKIQAEFNKIYVDNNAVDKKEPTESISKIEPKKNEEHEQKVEKAILSNVEPSSQLLKKAEEQQSEQIIEREKAHDQTETPTLQNVESPIKTEQQQLEESDITDSNNDQKKTENQKSETLSNEEKKLIKTEETETTQPPISQNNIEIEKKFNADIENLTETQINAKLKKDDTMMQETSSPTLNNKNQKYDTEVLNVVTQTSTINTNDDITSSTPTHHFDDKSIPTQDLLDSIYKEELKNENEKNYTTIGASSSNEKPIDILTPHNFDMLKERMERFSTEENQKGDPLAKELKDIPDTPRRNIDKTLREAMNDAEKYCHKESCNSLSDDKMNKIIGDSLGISLSENSTFRMIANEYVGSLRLLLPFPFCEFDNTGIIIFALLIVVITIHLVNVSLFGSSALQQDAIDKRLLHDCMTRLKEQDLELDKSKANSANAHHLIEARSVIQKMRELNNQLRATCDKLEAEKQEQANLLSEYDGKILQGNRKLEDMEDVLRSKDREIENLNSNISGLSTRNNSLIDELAMARNQIESLRHKNDFLKEENDELSSEITDVSEKLKLAEHELSCQKEMNSELQKKLHLYMNIVEELQAKAVNYVDGQPSAKKVKCVKAGAGTKSSANSSDSSGNVLVDTSMADADLDNQMMEHEENGAGSGGSGAWSDISEADVNDEAKPTIDEHAHSVLPSRKMSIGSASPTLRTKGKVRPELFEIAELKSQIRVLESERNTLLATSTVEQKEREGLCQRLEQLKQDLADKRREAEQRESERLAIQSQCQKLLQMVEERDNKSHQKEAEIKELHEKISQCNNELRKVEDEKRELFSRVRELEHSLRKAEEVNAKFENKMYHEERRLNAKINQLEEQLTKMHSLSPNASAMGDLNMSGNSSDREFGSRMPSGLPSLWSDVGSDSQYDPLTELEPPLISNNIGTGSLRLRNTRKSMQTLATTAGDLSSRGSPFELEEIWMNRANSIKEKRNSSAFRARSRSAGRQASGRQSASLVGVMPSPKSNLNALYLLK